MKFETKYLIRWGIPGWVFIMWILFALIIVNPSLVQNLVLNDLVKSLGILVTLASIGVPIGYLISQSYFAIKWVLRKDLKINSITDKVENFPYTETWGQDEKEDYFFLEYVWQSKLSGMVVEKRDYIVGRYSHLLRTTHGIGTLLYSSILSLAVILLVFKLKFELYYLIFIGVQCSLIWLMWKNYIYHSENVKRFQGYFLNEILNTTEEIKEEIKEDNSEALSS
ncbi:hypothetical protein COL32_08890 [Bacillus pseudomycoides]|uniref:hypothetical protein n=1 Tax=Bacillus pseudomycoides TaxID=64104 RepID=UPI000BF4C363|nr:hypothetical protein [Bacillus pseudomycoides]PEP74099.1 hypothetical protein CN584_28050 [Bacillus pseudomycoides]PFW91332.1 hypothetical protein COL29_19015 [Bacillus pseudomycoides]PFX46027.1 hypothetical protein COL32_08890 [Bacillus pseudomycoides]